MIALILAVLIWPLHGNPDGTNRPCTTNEVLSLPGYSLTNGEVVFNAPQIDRSTHPDHQTAYAAEWQCIQILYKYVACAGVVMGGDAAENKWKIEAYAATFSKGSQERTDILEDSTMMMGAWVYVDRYYRDGAGAGIPKEQQWTGVRYIQQ